MSVTGPADARDASEAYERLRRLVIGGANSGECVGLVVVLREGVAAWLATRLSRLIAEEARLRASVPRVLDELQAGVVRTPVAGPPPDAEGARLRAFIPRVLDELHAGVVRTLATMALAGRGEFRS